MASDDLVEAENQRLRGEIARLRQARDHAHEAEATITRLEAEIAALRPYVPIARDFVARWVEDGACGYCGALPHQAACHVGRFDALTPPPETTPS